MSKKKIALVTGADSGLGREFVRKLLEEDVEEIWAVARNKEKLEKLIYDYGKRIKIFPLDLTVRENFAHLQERLAGEGDISVYGAFAKSAHFFSKIIPALLYLRIILRGTAANGIFPIVPVSNQSSRQNGNKSQCPIPFCHSRLSSTDGLRFSQSVHSKEGR